MGPQAAVTNTRGLLPKDLLTFTGPQPEMLETSQGSRWGGLWKAMASDRRFRLGSHSVPEQGEAALGATVPEAMT